MNPTTWQQTGIDKLRSTATVTDVLETFLVSDCVPAVRFRPFPDRFPNSSGCALHSYSANGIDLFRAYLNVYIVDNIVFALRASGSC